MHKSPAQKITTFRTDYFQLLLLSNIFTGCNRRFKRPVNNDKLATIISSGNEKCVLAINNRLLITIDSVAINVAKKSKPYMKMKAGKPFLIAGIPIAGLALQSHNGGGGGVVVSAWSQPPNNINIRQHRHPTQSSSSIHTTSLQSSTELDINTLNLTPELEMMTNAFSAIPGKYFMLLFICNVTHVFFSANTLTQYVLLLSIIQMRKHVINNYYTWQVNYQM